MRRLALLTCVLALACASPAAATQPGWSGPQALGSSYSYSEWGFSLAVTSQGDVVATWPNSGGGNTLTVRKPNGETSSEALPNPARVAADGLGNAYLTYVAPDGQVHFKVRPPGGPWGSAEVLPYSTNGATPQVVAARDGDVALVWSNGGLMAAFRPKDGTFPATPDLIANDLSLSWPTGADVALSANGDLVAVGTSYAGPDQPRHVRAVARKASGEVTPVTLSDGSREPFMPSVDIDDSGRAIAVWSEKSGGQVTEVFTSQRAAGDGFGPRSQLYRTRASGAASAVMSHDGLYTLSAPGRIGQRLYSARAGEAPRKLRSYYEGGGYNELPLAASPSGTHVLQPLFAYSTKVISAMRTGDGAFEPMQDVNRDCGNTPVAFTAVGEGGHTGALLTDYSGTVLLVAGASVPEQRTCIPTDQWNPNAYLDDPYAPAASGEPGGGFWEPAGSDGRPPQAVPPFGMGMPYLVPDTGRSRLARVVVICGKPCRIDVAAKLFFQGPTGAVLAQTKRRRSGGAKPTVVEVPLALSAAAQKQLDRALRKRGRYPLTLETRVTISGSKVKKSERLTLSFLGPSF